MTGKTKKKKNSFALVEEFLQGNSEFIVGSGEQLIHFIYKKKSFPLLVCLLISFTTLFWVCLLSPQETRKMRLLTYLVLFFYLVNVRCCCYIG